jgi:mannonate dehydratase
MTHGADTGASDLAVIMAKPNKADRVYPREEMWQTFEYFINAILPTCEEFDVAMALHPNDPPVPYLDGIGSLIITADDYRRAFAIAKDSPYLGMKLCLGCWLEGGLLFSDDFLGDIAEFTKNGKVLNVHFRNVSGPLHPDYTGYFEETLAAEGYGDMYAIMKTLIANGFEGPIFCDHAVTTKPIGDAWIQGLIYAARTEVGYEMYGVK